MQCVLFSKHSWVFSTLNCEMQLKSQNWHWQTLAGFLPTAFIFYCEQLSYRLHRAHILSEYFEGALWCIAKQTVKEWGGGFPQCWNYFYMSFLMSLVIQRGLKPAWKDCTFVSEQLGWPCSKTIKIPKGLRYCGVVPSLIVFSCSFSIVHLLL